MISTIPESWKPNEGKIKVIAYDIITENQHKQSHLLNEPIEFDSKEAAENYFKQDNAEVCLIRVEKL